jgi:hypothetical protein
MECTILINEDGTTDLRHLKNQNAIVQRLCLSGTGNMGACIITFCHQEESATAHKEVMFLKALHEKSQILLPHIKSFNASYYDFCFFERFTGNICYGDEIKLSVFVENGD